MSTLILAAFVLCQDAKAAEEAVKQFTAAYTRKGASEADRIAAVKELGKTRHAETAGALAKLLGSGQPAVAVEAAKQLAEFTEVKNTAARVVPYLFEKVNLEKSGVRIEIVKCLGALKDPAGIPALGKALRERDLFVAKEVVAQLEAMRRREGVPVLIDYLKQCEQAPSGNVMLEVPVDLPNSNQPDLDYPQWNFSIVVGADEYQRMRKDTLHEPMLKALRSLTKESWKTYKGWKDWWTAAAPRFEVPKN